MAEKVVLGGVKDGKRAVVLVEADVVEAAVVGDEKGVSGVLDEQTEVFLETGAVLGTKDAQVDRPVGLGIVGKARVDADDVAAGDVAAGSAVVLEVDALMSVAVDGDCEMAAGPEDAWAVGLPVST